MATCPERRATDSSRILLILMKPAMGLNCIISRWNGPCHSDLACALTFQIVKFLDHSQRIGMAIAELELFGRVGKGKPCIPGIDTLSTRTAGQQSFPCECIKNLLRTALEEQLLCTSSKLAVGCNYRPVSII